VVALTVPTPPHVHQWRPAARARRSTCEAVLHDHSLTLDEIGKANFALSLKLASNWPHFNRIMNFDGLI
jgi:hypothetical protein